MPEDPAARLPFLEWPQHFLKALKVDPRAFDKYSDQMLLGVEIVKSQWAGHGVMKDRNVLQAAVWLQDW